MRRVLLGKRNLQNHIQNNHINVRVRRMLIPPTKVSPTQERLSNQETKFDPLIIKVIVQISCASLCITYLPLSFDQFLPFIVIYMSVNILIKNYIKNILYPNVCIGYAVSMYWTHSQAGESLI